MKNSSLNKKRRVRNFIFVIIDICVLVLVAYFIVGYLNFFKISRDQKPVFEIEKPVTYKIADGDDIVTVHDYKIYKIVKVKTEYPRKAMSFSMKLWFMDDVKR